MNILWVKYNTAVQIDGINLIAAASNDFVAPTFVAGDVKVEQDGGAAANITTLPSAQPAGGTSQRLNLSAAETSAKVVTVRLVDSPAKVWKDYAIQMFTYGHANAFLPFSFDDAAVADAVDAELTTEHGDGSWKQGATVVGTASNFSIPIRGDVTVGASVHWRIAFQIEDIDSTGWGKFAFVVKAEKDDADEDALVLIRLSDPGAGDDGLQVLNRRSADDETLGTISVDQETPDTNVTIELDAAASQHIRANENGGYHYELIRYIAGEPETLADGRIVIERRLRRAAAAP